MTPTIYTVIRGRTGNQFFQYAFARKIQEVLKIENLVLDFSELGLNKSIGKLGTNGYCNSLDDFNVVPYHYVDEGTTYNGDLITRLQYLIYRVRRKIISIIGFERSLKLERLDHRLLQLFGIYDITSSNCLSLVKLPKYGRKHILIRGFFEAPALFEDIIHVLRKELTSSIPQPKIVSDLWEQLNLQDSICVSVRRGDFASDEYKDRFLVCDLNYYYNGVNYILSCHPNSVVFVCSDDLEWCRDNIYFNTDNVIFEPVGLSICAKLHLMTACNHFVISNSTFSFWAQFLGSRKDKIVIAPKIWRNEMPRVTDIYMKSWTLIPDVDHS